MMLGISVMVSKSFGNPSPCGFFTTFRSPCLFSHPSRRAVNFKGEQIALSASSVLIFTKSSRTFSTTLDYEQFGVNTFVAKPHVKARSGEARFEQLAWSKDFSIRSFLSQSTVSQNVELAHVHTLKERCSKRSRNAAAAGHGHIISLSSFSVDEGFSLVSPEQKPVPPNFKIHNSKAVRSELSRSGRSLIGDRFRVRTGGSKVGGEEDRSEQRTDFEQWAVNKLREDGLSSLSIIEDMRQTFAPHSPPLDPRILFSGAEFRELESRAIANKSVQLKSTRNSHCDEESSSTSTNLVMPLDSKHIPNRSLQKITNVKKTEDSRSNATGSSNPAPLLVKRKTSLPENWNGPGGTVVLIDKRQGWTSFAVCGKLRHTLKVQKVGHAGTLDPMATGLLIVCLGKATKLADSYQAMIKVYSGTFRVGEDTPSLDADTQVSGTLPWEHITDEDIERTKQAFIGDILQSPPMYSAIKIKGERLYAKARRGEEIEVPARPVTVHEFKIDRSHRNRQEFHFRVTCSKGTYVRSLCSDLVRALGSYAHLTALRRERIGSYSVSDAWTVEDLVENYNQQLGNFTSRSKA